MVRLDAACSGSGLDFGKSGFGCTISRARLTLRKQLPNDDLLPDATPADQGLGQQTNHSGVQ